MHLLRNASRVVDVVCDFWWRIVAGSVHRAFQVVEKVLAAVWCSFCGRRPADRLGCGDGVVMSRMADVLSMMNSFLHVAGSETSLDGAVV